MPSDDEISRILAKTMKENPSQYAAVVVQIELARFLVKCIATLQDQLNSSIKQLGDSINK